jgi:HAD superfamily hydrolase (TIGR01509 family)
MIHESPDIPPHRQLVIFDCDGVLVDSERITHTVLCEMLAEMGVSISYEDAVRTFIGTTMPICVDRITQLLGSPPADDFLPQFRRRTRAAFEAGLTAVPGVEQVVSSLTGPFCVASNGNRAKVDFTLGHTGLMKWFDGRIFTAEDVRHPKPAPDLFLHAASALGAHPSNTTVIEDTSTGIAAARAAGMRAIGFAAMTPAATLEAAGAHAIAGTMAEVQVLLGRAG